MIIEKAMGPESRSSSFGMDPFVRSVRALFFTVYALTYAFKVNDNPSPSSLDLSGFVVLGSQPRFL